MTKETTELIDKALGELYNSLMIKPRQVLSIFNDFFGEDRVDMQGFPSVNNFKDKISNTTLNAYIPNEIFSVYEDLASCKLLCADDIPDKHVDSFIKALTDEGVKRMIGLTTFNKIFILVHFPHVRITNENNRYVDINHLWAKINIAYDGKLTQYFTLNRSEYSELHFKSNYMHSHISSIPMSNLTEFQKPCVGDGPIRYTMNSLAVEYSDEIWTMFCLELSKYVTVESLSGIPYNYLEKIGLVDYTSLLNTFTAYNFLSDPCISRQSILRFTEYLLNTKSITFNYINGSYSIGMSYPNYMIAVSNAFIKWYNEQFNCKEELATFANLKRNGVLKEYIISNGKIYQDEYNRTSRLNPTDYIGKKVCTFKGTDITLNITDIKEVTGNNKSILLNPKISLYILMVLLKVLNHRYGRESDKTGAKIWYL